MTKFTFVGYKCTDPPEPDEEHNLKLTWNPLFPPSHNETIKYV